MANEGQSPIRAILTFGIMALWNGKLQSSKQRRGHLDFDIPLNFGFGHLAF
jgi:hypothetical protein